METKCLNCNNLLEIQITDISIGELPKVECTSCQSIYNVTIKVELVPAPKEEDVTAVETLPAKDEQKVSELPEISLRNTNVAICISGLATCDILRDVLSYGNLKSYTIDKNDNLEEQILEIDPSALIIDIDMLAHHGVEMIEKIKETNKSGIKVLLLASIHRKDRYKRDPENLFGADAYIERHELRDNLLQQLQNIALGKVEEKVSRLHDISPEAEVAVESTPEVQDTIEAEVAVESTPEVQDTIEADLTEEPAEEPQDMDSIITNEANKPFTPTIVPDSSPATTEAEQKEEDTTKTAGQQDEEIEAARRLARIIISDIALYNNNKIEDGIRNGTFFNLLKEEIEEGKKLYGSRVSKDIQEQGNFYKEAIMEFIKSKKEQLSNI